MMLSPRADAARSVCGVYAIPTVAICLPPHTSSLSLASLHLNFIDSMGINATVLQSDHEGADAAASCHAAMIAREARQDSSFTAVLLLNASDLVWTQPMWPFCYHRWERSRQNARGSVLWAARAEATALLLGIEMGAKRPLLEDPLLATALRINPSTHECLAWRNATPAHAVHLPCPPRASEWWSSRSGVDGTYSSAWTSRVSLAQQLSRFSLAQQPHVSGVALAGAVCGTSGPRLALGLAGLARTFAHPLVYKALRGFLVDAIGARSTTVFAHLRLDDDRPVQTSSSGGKPEDKMPTDPRMRGRVLEALQALGASRLNSEVLSSSTRGGSRDDDEARRPPDCEYITHPVTPPRQPCDTYKDLCALPTALGQLGSRHAIYRLVLAHEARERTRFDSVLFMRPDLGVLVPLLPHCFHRLDVTRFFADHVVWMPRAHLDAVLGHAAAVFHSCAVRFEHGSEALFMALAAASNVTMLEDPTLQVMPIVRPPIRNMPPAGFVCKVFAQGLRRYTTTASGLTPHPALFHTAHMLHYTTLASSSCRWLTYANPNNKLD